jgi:hypothetical protein
MALTLFERYNTGDNFDWWLWGNNWRAQTITIGSSGENTDFTLKSIKLKVYRNGSPGTCNVYIRSFSEESGIGSENLSSGSFNANDLTDSSPGEFLNIEMSSVKLEAGKSYAIVFNCPDGSWGNELYFRMEEGTPTYLGGQYYYSEDAGSTWAALGQYDAMFEVWGEPISGNSPLCFMLLP